MLIFVLFLSSPFFGQSIEFSKAEDVEIPKLKSEFNFILTDFLELRLYHSIKDGDVKHINPKISDITNDSLIKDVNTLLRQINNSKLDSHYISGMPIYESAKEIKVLFLTSFFNGKKVELELFLQDDDFSKFTIREYFILNGGYYYVFNEKSTKDIKNSVILLIDKYTSYDKSLRPWEGPSKEKEEIIIFEVDESIEN